MDLLINFWQLFLLSAPWLMLGLFIAGLLNVYLPADFLNKHLGKEGFWTTVKAALIGAPMPLCSCGVIPAAIGLRRAGASKSATTAFLVSTPETGVDSVSVSYVLLGPFMAIMRPIAAICSAITAGMLVGKDSQQYTVKSSSSAISGCAAKRKPEPLRSCETDSPALTSAQSTSSCCATAEQTVTSSCGDVEHSPAKVISCCDAKHADKATETAMAKMSRAISFSCNKLLEDTMVWLMIGLFFAALVQTYVPASYLSQWGSGIIAMLVVILISIPMYICATASTPIAAGLLLSGVSPGAVLVFMLAGPATNIATLGVVGNELGKRAVIAYLTGVIGMALVFGFLTDYLVAEFGFVVAPLLGDEHQVLPHWLSVLTGLLLAMLILRLVFKKLANTGKSIA
ncbi:SO_0444 family Cu/Zn efflux transporter [Pseudoalteromonas mariniglutinosa]|uniref:SO_0444 family Cu/Zn efflux transporter n=1 Tax=Pseudoalteromonas mariniglutinosa TaxID=206042 RepID=UPI00384C6160